MDKELKKLIELVLKTASYKGLSEKEKKKDLYDAIHKYGERMYEWGHREGLEEQYGEREDTNLYGYTLADIYGD